LVVKTKRVKNVHPQYNDKEKSKVEKKPMDILDNEGERRFPFITAPHFTHSTRRGIPEKGAIIGLAVVVTRRPKACRDPQNQKRWGKVPPIKKKKR